MCLFLVRLDSLDLVDYSRTSGPIENIGGNNADDDIDDYNADYFQPATSKHSHFHPEDMGLTCHEGTITSSSATTRIF